MQKLIKIVKIRNFLLILVILGLNSCLSRVEKHGFAFDLTDYHLVEEGVTTQSKVLEVMGSPSVISDLDGEIWLYYSQNVKKLLFFRPDVVERRVLLLKFDDSGVVSELKNYDLDDEKRVRFAMSYTKVEGAKKGFFKSIFSNIGQISPQ